MIESQIIDHQPVGTLIVDRATVVRFANPAAARLLGLPVQRLVGHEFGLPIVPEGVTDINVADDRGDVRTLAMSATPLPSGDGEHLITLFDVSGRTRVYEHEHRLVEALQRSILLDEMPELPGIALAARYLPGGGEVRVGGDWYDAIPLADGRLGLAIGDVVGHGIESASMMGQLRNALRAYALEHSSPAAVLSRLDRLIALQRDGMATAIYLVYDPHTTLLTLAAAGHPYPLLIRPDGHKEFLTGGRSVPLGTYEGVEREDTKIALPPESTLVLYTDGLVERRSRTIDEGLEQLAASLDSDTPDPATACEAILGELVGAEPPPDDVALLVMRTSKRAHEDGAQPAGSPDQLLTEIEGELLLEPAA